VLVLIQGIRLLVVEEIRAPDAEYTLILTSGFLVWSPHHGSEVSPTRASLMDFLKMRQSKS
jgi:hypothetical protein